MKYYKFEEEFDWKELTQAVEEAEANDTRCWDLEELMTDSVICGSQTPEQVEDIDESIDGLFMEDGEEGDSVECTVIHDGKIVYEFDYLL